MGARGAQIWNRCETFLAVLLFAACTLQTGRMIHAMATTSLSTDEFGTVGGYSRRGPLHVITDYSAPKNHIFFNLVNSVLPGRASLNPLRVRMFSLVAAALFLSLVISYAIFRGALFEGAVFLTLWTFAPESLQLCLEARGYGFLALAGLVVTIAAMEYFRTDRRGWLYTAAGVVILAVYTVPGFIFFGAPILLLVWLARRDRFTFLVGLAAAIAVALLYSPVAFQIVEAFHKYGTLYESDFKLVQGVIRAIKLYIFASPDWAAFAFLSLLSLAPFLLAEPAGETRGRKIVISAALFFFLGLLYTRTAPVRMSNMGMVPFAFVGVFALGAAIRTGPIFVRSTAFGLVAIGLIFRIAPEVRDFHFTPHEDWTTASLAIEQAFGPEMPVDYKRYAKYLGDVSPDLLRRSAPFDEAAYASGRLIVADAGNKWAEGRRFFRPADEPHNAQIVIPGATRDMVLSFQLPIPSRNFDVPSELTDRNVNTGIEVSARPLRLQIERQGEHCAIVFLLDHPVTSETFHLSAEDRATGALLPAKTLFAGNAVIVSLGALPPGVRHLRFELHATGPAVSITEVWISSKPNRGQ